jgi:hypothetical protein
MKLLEAKELTVGKYLVYGKNCLSTACSIIQVYNITSTEIIHKTLWYSDGTEPDKVESSIDLPIMQGFLYKKTAYHGK